MTTVWGFLLFLLLFVFLKHFRMKARDMDFHKLPTFFLFWEIF